MCGTCEDQMSGFCPACSEPELEEAECPSCQGVKKYVSDCCGEPMMIDTDFCSGCRDHCGSEEEICDTCKGEGVIQFHSNTIIKLFTGCRTFTMPLAVKN